MALLVSLVLLAEVVQDDELNYRIELPAGWEVVQRTKKKLHLKNGATDIQLLVVKGGPATLEALARWWQPTLETQLNDPRDRKISKGAFGGEPCMIHEIKAQNARVTWLVARRGKLAYAFHVQRAGDEDHDEDVRTIRKSFRFLREARPDEPKPKPRPQKPQPKPEPRKELTFDHWRVDCVKPAGLRQRDPKDFDPSERANSVVARFDGQKQQGRLMIRVFAHSRSVSISRLAKQRIQEFEKRYEKRKQPVQDTKWKLPLARKTIRLELVGLKQLKHTHLWYFAECGNQRSYQIQVYISGPTPPWKDVLDDFLRNFKPFRKRSPARMAG